MGAQCRLARPRSIQTSWAPQMNIHGGCKCGNIEIVWQVDEPSLSPRACQCDYCVARNASYVSSPNSEISVTIKNSAFHYIVCHGTNIAEFHECSNCNTLVFVSADINNSIYGVINSSCLPDLNFEAPVKMQFSQETTHERLVRRSQNWCHPVLITSTS